MQHLNDDMDELFRKAADDYPLNTGNPDWNKIAEALSQEITPNPENKKSYRRFTWLLLLLPLAFICNMIYDPGLFRQMRDGKPSSKLSEKHQRNPKAGNADQTEVKKSELLVSPGDRQQAQTKTEPQSAYNQSMPGIIGSATRPNTRHINTRVNSGVSVGVNSGVSTGVNADVNTDANAGVNTGVDSDVNPHTKSGLNSDINPMVNPGINPTNAESNYVSDIKGEPDITSSTKIFLVPFSTEPDISAVPIPGITELQPGPTSKKRLPNKNFYLGLAGGLDLTTVNFQQTSKVGTHYGGIAGYSFRKKWSVEAGFFVDKKHYYTDPKYFEKGKLPYRPNSTILSVDGSCTMFEIPVSIKYDITNTFKSSFFVTGGLSSYIMKNEDYTVVYLYNTSGSTAPHHYSYKNASTNLFSELRLTGGYSVKIPKSFSIRVEPYLNIPLSGVGRGNLNLMSAGVNAGIFKRLF